MIRVLVKLAAKSLHVQGRFLSITTMPKGGIRTVTNNRMFCLLFSFPGCLGTLQRPKRDRSSTGLPTSKGLPDPTNHQEPAIYVNPFRSSSNNSRPVPDTLNHWHFICDETPTSYPLRHRLPTPLFSFFRPATLSHPSDKNCKHLARCH